VDHIFQLVSIRRLEVLQRKEAIDF